MQCGNNVATLQKREMCSAVFTSIPCLLYTLVAATLLLFSSINNDDHWSGALALLTFALLIINSFLHYRANADQRSIIERKLNDWIESIENDVNTKCTKIGEGGTTKETQLIEGFPIPFYDLTTGDIVHRDDRFSFILDYVSDKSLTQNNKIRIAEPVRDFLSRSLAQKRVKTPIFDTISAVIGKFDLIFVPIASIFAVVALIINYIFAEPEEDYADQRFDILVCVLVVIPLLRLTLPMLVVIHILSDNLIIKYMISPQKSISTLLSLVNLKNLLTDCSWSSMASRLSSVTGVCATDKKGILATSEPVLEKIFFLTSAEGETSGEVLHVSSDICAARITAFSFDDVVWHRFIHSICPLVESVRVNKCLNDGEKTNCLCAIRQLIPNHITDGASNSATFKIFRNSTGDELGRLECRSFQAQCAIQKEGEMNRVHLRGSPSLLLPGCVTYWDGAQVRPMTEKVVGLAADFASRHSITSHCVALSCGTASNLQLIGDSNEWKKREEEIKPTRVCSAVSALDLSDSSLLHQLEAVPQTFLALAASQEQALPSVFEMIESLQSACIRFILFSKENQLRSRIIGEKLGLEAGWNCHISLKNEIRPRAVTVFSTRGRRSSCPEGSNLHTVPSAIPCLPPNMARLPTGVQEIRPHLEEVDNVPLLVSLFTDCTVDTTREMIDILHEYGESELLLGSVHSNDNLLSLMKGVFSIGVYPLCVSACMLQCKNGEEEGAIASLATDLVINQSQISFLPRILAFSRQRASLFNQSLSFYLISSVALSLHYLLSLVLLLPFPISSFDTILLSLIIHPLLTLSISTYNDWTPRVALTSPPSLLSHPTTEFFFYHMPHLITLSATHALMLTLSGHFPCLLPYVCDWIVPFTSHASVQQVESLISFLRIISLILASTPHIFPYENSYRRLPFINPIWSIIVIFSLSLQFYFSHKGSFTEISPSIFFFYAMLSTISIVIAQSYKRTNIRIFRKENRRRKFGFDTKLGMNSPY